MYKSPSIVEIPAVLIKARRKFLHPETNKLNCHSNGRIR